MRGRSGGSVPTGKSRELPCTRTLAHGSAWHRSASPTHGAPRSLCGGDGVRTPGSLRTRDRSELSPGTDTEGPEAPKWEERTGEAAHCTFCKRRAVGTEQGSSGAAVRGKDEGTRSEGFPGGDTTHSAGTRRDTPVQTHRLCTTQWPSVPLTAAALQASPPEPPGEESLHSANCSPLRPWTQAQRWQDGVPTRTSRAGRSTAVGRVSPRNRAALCPRPERRKGSLR